MDSPELDGFDSSIKFLTAFSPPTRKPGRPPKIATEVLQHNRNELLFALEENWAFIGWQLRQADKTLDIREAFGKMHVRVNCRGLEIFSEQYRRETTFPQLEAARKRLRKLLEMVRSSNTDWTSIKESAERVQKALSNTHDPEKRGELRTICLETEKAFANAETTRSKLESRMMRLQNALRRREASFAQSELLDFIQSDRYVSSPLTIANAMAGLPLIHWRQSMERCLKLKEQVPLGLRYRRFRVVAEAFKNPAPSADQAVGLMKARLLRARGKDVALCNELAENWHFLKSAIESAFKAEGLNPDEFPFRILAEYQSRVMCPSVLDTLIARKQALTTLAFVKERRASHTV